jgi:ABC-2 type transport system permease protein
MAVSSMAGFGMSWCDDDADPGRRAISQEMATGSIKSLIIAPVRRWKIFTAKVLSLVSVSLIATILLYLVMILTHGLMFGFSSGQPYIFASHGQAGALSFAIYQLASLLVRWISVLVFIALALMLSVVTRNTAAAVGISMAIFFGHQLIGSFLMFLPRSEWVKFIPFEHFSLLPRFFHSPTAADPS